MGEGLIRDPVTADAVTTLTRRVAALEQRPKVTAPIMPQPHPLVALSGGANWDHTIAVVAAFAPYWQARIPVVALPGLACTFADLTTGGSTGEVRVRIVRGVTTVTSTTFAQTGGGSQQVLGWLHGLDLWDVSDPYADVFVDARMASGAGTYIFGRPVLTFLDRRACTASGGTWYSGVWLPGGGAGAP